MTTEPKIDDLIAQSSIGAALADAKERGWPAHLADLERELARPRGRQISADLRAEASLWCQKLARDRAQSGWSIRFTQDVIDSCPATKLAWRAHVVVRDRLGQATPPQALWAEAEALLRGGWAPPIAGTPAPMHAAPVMISKKGSAKKTWAPDEAVRSSAERSARRKEAVMAKKQSRRTISISRAAFERAKAFAKQRGVPLSQLAETALAIVIKQGDNGGE